MIYHVYICITLGRAGSWIKDHGERFKTFNEARVFCLVKTVQKISTTLLIVIFDIFLFTPILGACEPEMRLDATQGQPLSGLRPQAASNELRPG